MFLTRLLLFSALLPAFTQAGFLRGEIIHGKNASKTSFQYMASLQVNGKHKCGGFLVSPRFVLTAAHCDTSDNVMVILGTHNLKQNGNSVQKLKVVNKYKNNYKDVQFGNDIMLLELSKPVNDSKVIKKAKIPHKDISIMANTKCQVAGWGLTKTGGQTVMDLQVAEVAVIDAKVCKDMWKSKRNQKIPEKIICAGGYKTKMGACQGDSGGPLVCGNTVVGVVSFNMDGNCNYPNLPNVYTRISKFLPWIQKIIKKI